VKPPAVAVLACALAIAAPARGALDPATARVDAAAARADERYRFCDEPRLPLSQRARSLCPHASEIPSCDGFASACAAAAAGRDQCAAPSQPRPDREWPGWPWIAGLARLLGGLAKGAVWLMVLGLAAAVLAPAWGALRRARRDRGLRDPDPAAAKAAETRRATGDSGAPLGGDAGLLARADRHAARGENALAMQVYLAASLCALDRRGSVRIASGRTNGEYVRSCSVAEEKQRLREIVREVERVQFGRQDATSHAVAAVALHARVLVSPKALAPTLVALTLALPLCALCACGGGDPACYRDPRPGDDPAGLELFYDVLRRQRVTIEPLGQSLATLEIGDSAAQPAVVVDLQRTWVDEETRDHLVQWVRAGGELVLAGSPDAWPPELGAGGAVVPGSHQVLVRVGVHSGAQADDEAAAAPPAPAVARARAQLAEDTALQIAGDGEGVVASFEDGSAYAVRRSLGRGHVLGVAGDELFTNAGLSRDENAAAMVALISNADRPDFRVAEPHQGVAPPSTPWASLARAGLGLGLVHALFAIAAAFLSTGVRLARPRSAPLPRRRSFTEHVRAVGALYACTGSAAHALSAYARFAEERLRARMPRGTSDIPEFLASRTQQPVDRCRTLWTRAVAPSGGRTPSREELAVLRDLSALCSSAMAQDR